MNYELFALEEIINGFLEGGEDEDIKRILYQEKVRVLNSIKLVMVNCNHESAHQYIRGHQHGLTELMDIVFQDRKKTPPESQRIKDEILQSLSYLFKELESKYSSFLDSFVPIPKAISTERLSHLKVKFERLLSSFENFESPILSLRMLRETLTPELKREKNISLSRFQYLQEFIDTLELQLSSAQGNDFFELLLLVAGLNFNHPDFYNFCCDFFSRQRQALHTIDSQLEAFSLFKNRLVQKQIAMAKIYRPDLEQIGVSLQRFLETEISFLKELKGMSEVVSFANEHFKINFTVRQLGIFVSLQAACGIIQTDRPKLIHEYVTGHYSTDEAEHISEKSFKNAYYNNARSDLDKVLEKLTEMLVLGQKRY